MAIAEASQRPNINCVPIKTIEQQDIQALHRLRDRYVANRVALTNQIHCITSEYGIAFQTGHKAFRQFISSLYEPQHKQLTPLIKSEIAQAEDLYYWLSERISDIEEKLKKVAEKNRFCQILLSIPGIGLMNATALYSAIGNASQFTKGRDLSIWLGLTSKQKASGETSRMTGITKRGHPYLRKQLIHGARAALSRSKGKEDKLSTWAQNIVERRGFAKATVTFASKIARIAFVLISKNELYKPQH